MSLQEDVKAIAEIDFMFITDDGNRYKIENKLSAITIQQILDLCQPKWIYVDDRFPDAEPHRNIEIACVSPYPDDEKSPYSIHVSTRLPIKAFEGAYAWREVVLPEPPGESE